MKRSKKYIEAQKLITPDKKYSLAEALDLLPKVSFTKFAGSVNLQITLSLNEKQKKEVIRGAFTLPHSFGKTIKILVLADKSDHAKAKEADIGIAGGLGCGVLFKKGKIIKKVSEERIVSALMIELKRVI